MLADWQKFQRELDKIDRRYRTSALHQSKGKSFGGAGMHCLRRSPPRMNKNSRPVAP